MKKVLQYSFLIIFLALTSSTAVTAQPHPGEQNGGGGVSGSRLGNSSSGAPIGSGTMLLIGLAGLYGGKKVYYMRKSLEA